MADFAEQKFFDRVPERLNDRRLIPHMPIAANTLWCRYLWSAHNPSDEWKGGHMVDAPQTGGQSPAENAAPDKPTDHARGAGGAVKDRAQDAAARGAATAGNVAGQVKDAAVAATEKGKDEIAGRLEEIAGAVHRSGEQLEGEQDWLAQLVERGADELGHLASTVRSNDLRGLLGKLQDLARRQPVLFVGAAMAAGFASARLGKVAISGAARSGPPKEEEGGNGQQ